MNNPNYDRMVPLILAGHRYDDFILKYDMITNRLAKLEKQYQITQPGFNISPMWACHCTNGKVIYSVTGKCYEHELKARLLAIFNSAGIVTEMDCKFY